MKQSQGRARSGARRAFITSVTSAAVLGGCRSGVLDPQGPVAAQENLILFDSLVIMLAIIVPTMLATLAFAWWYRASNGRARYLPDWAYSGRLEVVVWAIPLLTIMFLGGIAWIGSHDLDPARPLPSKAKPLEVQVVSLDWKWLFIYPEQQIASVNTLVIPAGTPVHFQLTSASVMNTFFVPQLGSMIYTMTGMADNLNLQADKPGRYWGQSSHYSGDGFSGMHFYVDALPAEGFNGWVQKAKASGPVLDQAAYRRLSRQSQDVQPFTYRAAAPNLFQEVVSEALPPGPGPGPGAAGQPPSVFPKGGK